MNTMSRKSEFSQVNAAAQVFANANEWNLSKFFNILAPEVETYCIFLESCPKLTISKKYSSSFCISPEVFYQEQV